MGRGVDKDHLSWKVGNSEKAIIDAKCLLQLYYP